MCWSEYLLPEDPRVCVSVNWKLEIEGAKGQTYHRQIYHKNTTRTAEVRALGVEHILGDLEEASWAHHRPVNVVGLDAPPLIEVEYS